MAIIRIGLLFSLLLTLCLSALRPLQAAVCQASCPEHELAPQQEPTQPTDAAVEDEETQATIGANQQRRVKVNFFINSISNVNDRDSAWDLDFYLDFYWQDPALEKTRFEEVDQSLLWDPMLEVVNAKNYQVIARSYSTSLEPDTNVRLNYRIVGTFFNLFDLRKFPFDQQLLTLRLQSSDYDANLLRFDFAENDSVIPYSDTPVESPTSLVRHLSQDYTLANWDVNGITVQQQLVLLPYDKSSWAEFRVEIPIARQSQSYVFRIMLELVFLLLLFWGILCLDYAEIRYRLLLLFMLLLATITFNFVMLQILPSVPYLTLLDYLMILCYCAIAQIAFLICLIKFLHNRNQIQWAVRLNRMALLFYPVFLLVAGGLLYWYTVYA